MHLLHKKFTEDIENRIKAQSEFLCNGGAKDMQEYGRRCGYLTALDDIKDSFEAIYRQFKEDD